MLAGEKLMSIVSTKELLCSARKQGKGVGSFSVYDIDALIGAIKAAEDLNTPIIIQLAEPRFKTAPLHYVGAAMLGAAKNAKVDIAVHLDHGITFATLREALAMGFTSVMYDGSTLDFQENVKNTKQMIEFASPYKATTEAELGRVGKGEDGLVDYGVIYTEPQAAVKFVEETNVDALAIAIGNKHGNYKGEPNLQFDILQLIHSLLPEQFLVLHGGSGISDSDFQKCIRLGITKINIATATCNAITKAAKAYTSTANPLDFYHMHEKFSEAAYEIVKHHIRVFNMELIDD